MTKLELAQAIQREVFSQAVGRPITTTVITSGMSPQQLQCIRWLEDEYRALWTERLWTWRQVGETVITTAAVNPAYDYTVAEQVVPWAFRIKRADSSAWIPLTWVDWEDWLVRYDYVYDQMGPGFPVSVTQLPNKDLRLTPQPDTSQYEVYGQYFLPFAPMDDDTDEPPWHEDLHDILVWRTARRFLQEVGSAPLTNRVAMVLSEREQAFRNRYTI